VRNQHGPLAGGGGVRQASAISLETFENNIKKKKMYAMKIVRLTDH
jgi:hypothetical protein